MVIDIFRWQSLGGGRWGRLAEGELGVEGGGRLAVGTHTQRCLLDLSDAWPYKC